MLENSLRRDDRSLRADEKLQHCEFLRSQTQRSSGARGETLGGVELKVAMNERGGQGWAATGECPDAGDQLCGGERLGKVVVGSEIQALNAIPDRAGGGEHEHAAAVGPGDDRPADVIAMNDGQVTVEHNN